MTALLDDDSAAAYLNFKTSTLAKWRTQGRGPRFVKIGGAVRYRQADLDEFIAENTVASTAEAGAR